MKERKEVQRVRAMKKELERTKWRGAMILGDDIRGENNAGWAKEIFENLEVTSC